MALHWLTQQITITIERSDMSIKLLMDVKGVYDQ